MKLLLTGIQPVSTNNMYWAMSQRTKNGKYIGRIVPTDELKNYKHQIKTILFEATKGLDPLPVNEFYKLSIEVSYPIDSFFNKDGTVKQRDASNVIKALEDGIYEALGVNDKQNMKVSVEKFYNKENETYIFTEITKHTKSIADMERGKDYYLNHGK